jgi:hypothetical protein
VIGATGHAVGTCVTAIHAHEVLKLCCQLEADFVLRGRFILAVCIPARRIAFKTPFSDFNASRWIIYCFSATGILFSVLIFFLRLRRSFFAWYGHFTPKIEKMGLRRQNISTPQ